MWPTACRFAPLGGRSDWQTIVRRLGDIGPVCQNFDTRRLADGTFPIAKILEIGKAIKRGLACAGFSDNSGFPKILGNPLTP